ncbi:hypothetical protein N7456_008642 [Penicillium angulare]|uniref:Uncharacterized protein n=1 Tax=Penicillium angulare TaxID=116970 RepID=A0A9W9F389_9EURO|nr:hypothetical protein N7456_008642 [Penicillium angulare]
MGLQQLEQSDSGNYDQESDNHEVMPQYSQKDSLNTEHGDFGDCFMLTDDILSDFACQLELQNPGSFATSTFEQLNAGYFNSSAGEKTGFELSGDYILSSLIQPAFDFLGSADLGPPAPQGKKSDRTSLAESRPHDK